MVRLKVKLIETQEGKIKISIPYGSIKRNPNLTDTFVSAISIPYGSIKSGVGEGRADCIISIPYGSIKRQRSQLESTSNVISIPYGSIKREVHRLFALCTPYFNSLWFD